MAILRTSCAFKGGQAEFLPGLGEEGASRTAMCECFMIGVWIDACVMHSHRDLKYLR